MIQKGKFIWFQCFPKNSFAADIVRIECLHVMSSIMPFCLHYVDNMNYCNIFIRLSGKRKHHVRMVGKLCLAKVQCLVMLIPDFAINAKFFLGPVIQSIVSLTSYSHFSAKNINVFAIIETLMSH